jgi:hypothetical protein
VDRHPRWVCRRPLGSLTVRLYWRLVRGVTMSTKPAGPPRSCAGLVGRAHRESSSSLVAEVGVSSSGYTRAWTGGPWSVGTKSSLS